MASPKEKSPTPGLEKRSLLRQAGSGEAAHAGGGDGQPTFSEYENLQGNVRDLKLPAIEVWENRYMDKNYLIRLETPEFTCICPKTGLPDFATISIEYCPDEWCVELKSFKLYLHALRNVGIFHEHVTNRVFDDFVKATRPRSAKIRAEFNLRGGIKTTVEREYSTSG